MLIIVSIILQTATGDWVEETSSDEWGEAGTVWRSYLCSVWPQSEEWNGHLPGTLC